MFQLKLENFRLFGQKELLFNRSNLIIGKNGVGKSSIIEAIYLLNYGRSYRTSNDDNLINEKEISSYINAHLDENERLSIVLDRQQSKKTAYYQGKKIPLSQLIGKLPSVLFAPELISLISGPPILRRRYLDMVLTSADPMYLHSLLNYRQILKQRNSLLQQGIIDDRLFLPWEIELSRFGKEIIIKRQSFTNYLNGLVDNYYRLLKNKKTTIQLYYLSTIKDLEGYQEAITSGRSKDQRFKTTLLGPHRDELAINVNGRLASFVASRGEQRMIILAIKRAEIDFLMLDNNNHPIILLDDLLGELDVVHSQALQDLIQDYPYIITTTDATDIPVKIKKEAKIFQL